MSICCYKIKSTCTWGLKTHRKLQTDYIYNADLLQVSKTYNFQNSDQFCRKNGQIYEILKFHLNCILCHSFSPNWLKFGPNSLRMILKKFKEAFLKILVISYSMLVFIKKSRNLLLSATKSKVHASMAYKLKQSYEPARFVILIYFRSLKPIIFKILTSFAEKMAKNAKFSNFT